jgi:Na+/H+-dicarboxylate symporter
MRLNFLKFTTPIQITIVLACVILFGNALPKTVQAFFYAISLTLKDLLLFALPILIFSCSFLSLSTVKNKKSIGLILVIVLIIVCISNYVATFVAYGVVSLKLLNINISSLNVINNEELMPLWHTSLPEWMPSNYALLCGFAFGFLSTFMPTQISGKLNLKASRFIDFFLNKLFIRLLPLFVLGFIIKMQYDGVLAKTLAYCLPLMLLISATYLLYIAFLFAVIANFNLPVWIKYIKNVIPVAVTGFTTMSSLATMPITINAAEKNTEDPNIARLIIPITANIHMIGLAINIPIMALSILLGFGYGLPAFTVYCTFAFYFILTQFAGAGAPGCGILLMIPLLEAYLGFTREMSALIIVLYVLFDAAETSANVLGNSALVIVVSKIYKALNEKCIRTQDNIKTL